MYDVNVPIMAVWLISGLGSARKIDLTVISRDSGYSLSQLKLSHNFHRSIIPAKIPLCILCHKIQLAIACDI